MSIPHQWIIKWHTENLNANKTTLKPNLVTYVHKKTNQFRIHTTVRHMQIDYLGEIWELLYRRCGLNHRSLVMNYKKNSLYEKKNPKKAMDMFASSIFLADSKPLVTSMPFSPDRASDWWNITWELHPL